jgi:hypothetical protein
MEGRMNILMTNESALLKMRSLLAAASITLFLSSAFLQTAYAQSSNEVPAADYLRFAKFSSEKGSVSYHIDLCKGGTTECEPFGNKKEWTYQEIAALKPDQKMGKRALAAVGAVGTLVLDAWLLLKEQDGSAFTAMTVFGMGLAYYAYTGPSLTDLERDTRDVVNALVNGKSVPIELSSSLREISTAIASRTPIAYGSDRKLAQSIDKAEQNKRVVYSDRILWRPDAGSAQ